jgi:hypothetical protein
MSEVKLQVSLTCTLLSLLLTSGSRGLLPIPLPPPRIPITDISAANAPARLFPTPGHTAGTPPPDTIVTWNEMMALAVEDHQLNPATPSDLWVPPCGTHHPDPRSDGYPGLSHSHDIHPIVSESELQPPFGRVMDRSLAARATGQLLATSTPMIHHSLNV